MYAFYEVRKCSGSATLLNVADMLSMKLGSSGTSGVVGTRPAHLL